MPLLTALALLQQVGRCWAWRRQFARGPSRLDLFAPGSIGEQLWAHGNVSHLLTNGSLGARTTGLLALFETPEVLEGYLLRAQSQDDAKRLTAGRGWLT